MMEPLPNEELAFASISPDELAQNREKISNQTLKSGVPGTDSHLSMWIKRLDNFRQMTLNQDLTSPPSLEGLQVFLYFLPKIIKGQGENGSISLEYFQVSLSTIKKNLTFRYKGFNVDKHDDARLSKSLTLQPPHFPPSTDPSGLMNPTLATPARATGPHSH
ncbi:hypothetical protein NXS19_001200 [Fusarium pseudograminearum]|nr:hypothetical protein NXS19_001200 [Fusarium pseudograminearum]